MIRQYRLKTRIVNAIRADLKSLSGMNEMKSFLGYRFINQNNKEIIDIQGNSRVFNYVTFTNYTKNGMVYNDVVMDGQWLFYENNDKVIDSMDEEKFLSLYDEVY